MNRIALGAILALVLTGVGLFWWQGRAEVERGAPLPLPLDASRLESDLELPQAVVGDLLGPEPPQATELTREQRRFFRYDRNRDLKIGRNEMLASRTEAFRKLDVDGNNLLTFEEWAVATVDRFEGADADDDNWLTPSEFATTKPPPRQSPACRC
ncbi:MAG: hypothetical protein KKE77_13490 [Alphaproteobacteria bacterium]|jgi:hypothetical protein|nr:hypothetical protein [Alphaproteobacteria bacterium]